MSIVSKIARFAIRAILTSLVKEAASADRKSHHIVTACYKRIAALDKEIIARANVEDAEIDKVEAKAREEIQRIKAKKTKLMSRKLDHRINCSAECRQLRTKAENARVLKAKLEAKLEAVVA